jgi:hypothetical protein
VVKGLALINMGHYRRFYRQDTHLLLARETERFARGNNFGNGIIDQVARIQETARPVLSPEFLLVNLRSP